MCELVAAPGGDHQHAYAATSHVGWVGGSHWLGVGEFIGRIVRDMGMSARVFVSGSEDWGIVWVLIYSVIVIYK